MPRLVNRAKMTTFTTGTGTLTLGSAVNGFQTFAAAGVNDGNVVHYVIEDGASWEIGSGTYTSAVDPDGFLVSSYLSRNVIESSASGALLNLSGSAVVYISALATDIETNTTISRAFMVSAIAEGFVPEDGNSYLLDGLVYIGTAGATAIPDLPGLLPAKPVSVLHFGAVVNDDTAGAVNLAAFNAAKSISPEEITFPGGATVWMSGTLEYNGRNLSLRSDDDTLARVYFTDDFDGSLIRFAPADALANTMMGSNSAINIRIQGAVEGTGSTRTSRIGFDILKQEDFRMINCRWTRVSFGLRVLGGQNNSFARFRGDGTGHTVGNHLPGSYHIYVGNAPTTTGEQPTYTCRFEDFALSGGGRDLRNMQDIIRIGKSDGHFFTRGYISSAANALLRLDPEEGQNITSLYFSDVYFDGVAEQFVGTNGTPYGVYCAPIAGTGSPDDGVGNINSYVRAVYFTNCNLANYRQKALYLPAGNRVQFMKFTGGTIGTAHDRIGEINGRTTTGSTGGLSLHMHNTRLRNVNGGNGLIINSARLLDLNCDVQDIADASGAIQINGTVQHKALRIAVSNCPGGIVDTSTGVSRLPHYEWLKQGQFAPTLTIGGSSTGITYTTQNGFYQIVGSAVHVQGTVAISATGGLTGTVAITGLPFTNIAQNCAASVYFVNGAAGLASLHGEIIASTKRIRLGKVVSGGVSEITNTDITATFTVRFSVTYQFTDEPW